MNTDTMIRPHLKNCELYPLLKEYKPGLTESVNTNPFYGAYRHYPDPIRTKLREKYLSYLFEAEGLTIQKEAILFTAGCTEALSLLIHAFCEPNLDVTAVFYPSIVLFKDIALKNDIRSVAVKLQGINFTKVPSTDYQSYKLLFLTRPNNPVGTCVTLTDLKKFLKSLDRQDTLLVIDETYIDFSNQQSALSLLAAYDNLVVIRSFSKSWGLAGVRLGCLFATPRIIESVRKVQLPFSVNAVAQESLYAAIGQSHQFQSSLYQFKQERDRIKNYLQQHRKIKTYDSESMFLLVTFPNYESSYQHLTANHYSLVDFSDQIPYTCRIAIGTADYNNRLLEEIKQIMS